MCFRIEASYKAVSNDWYPLTTYIYGEQQVLYVYMYIPIYIYILKKKTCSPALFSWNLNTTWCVRYFSSLLHGRNTTHLYCNQLAITISRNTYIIYIRYICCIVLFSGVCTYSVRSALYYGMKWSVFLGMCFNCIMTL